MNWAFCNTGLRSGQFNMEFDQLLARKLKDNSGFPTLRVYGWNPYTISIGSNQTMSDFDLAKIRQDKIDIVQRPTGGRAIFHAHELTYCVVLQDKQKSPREVYYSISKALLSSLSLFGINGNLTDSDDNFQSLYRNNTSLPCFASSAKYEIQFNDKKIIGSAQRRYGDVVLQHGSLLLGPQHLRIIDYLAPHIQHEKEQLKNTLLNKTIDAETILQRRVTYEETVECIKKGFENTWEITFTEYSPKFDLVEL